MLYMHSSRPSILHRDLKASNILIGENLTNCVICDFGLSRLAEERAALSSVGGNVGTPYTMAPEIMDGSPYTKASDVYSFGIILWEMWTGRIPFHGFKAIQLMFQVYSQGARPPTTPVENIHPELERLMRRCWEQNPEMRPQFDEILDILDEDGLRKEMEDLTLTQVGNGVPVTGHQLMEAVFSGDVALVEQFVKMGVDVNFSDYDRRSPLHIAAAEGYESITRILLNAGADVGVVDRWGYTPLLDAKRCKNHAIKDLLIEFGAKEVELERVKGAEVLIRNTEMMDAINRRDIETVIKCLDDSASATFCDYDHRTPLHLAASEGYPEIAELLIQRGAVLDARDRWGSTPIHDAQRAGHRDVQLMIELSMEKQKLKNRAES